MEIEEITTGAGKVVPWLYCANIDRSTEFYCGVLGFTLLGQTIEEKSAYVDSQGARIMLQEMGPSALLAGVPEHPLGRGMYLLLQTEDVDTLLARLHATVGEEAILMRPRNRYYRVGEDLVGHRELVLKDPDGYILRFYHNIEGLEEA